MSDDADRTGPAHPARAGEEKPPLGESVEEAASGKLGVQQWNRPGIFRETAAAATDADLPYWLALILSGAIATLGLAIDSSAVVIGAMLVAPLLAPVLGLAMALSVGDGRLAIQAGSVVLVSTLAVVATAALLTMALPFQTITLEISRRTRPTTLDLAIAVFSGLVGAVVTVSRGRRLSAVIPGVAIAVALIPPLAVAGFGIGASWNARLIHGALLLYGANLAGIVLSGMLVFLLVGMHRPNVLAEARRWHSEGRPAGIASWVLRNRWVRSVGMMESPWKRVTLVMAFVVAVAVPLSETLGQLARERRVREAVEVAAELFSVPGRSSIVSRQVILGDGRSQIYLRLATSERFDVSAQEEFERRASAGAGEPVSVVLEQLLTSPAEVDLVVEGPRVQAEGTTLLPRNPSPDESVRALRDSIHSVAATLPLPEGAVLAGAEVTVLEEGGSIRIGYLADAALPAEAEGILEALLRRSIRLDRFTFLLEHVPAAAETLNDSDATQEILRRTGALLGRYPPLGAEFLVGTGVTDGALDSLRESLVELVGDEARVRVVRDHPEAGLHLRLHRTAREPQ